MSKIIELQAENIKKLKVIEIKPKDNMVLLTGKNGQGKSSILDCITYALMGKAEIPKHPIRNGEQTGTIKLDLGDVIVTRTFIRKDDGSITTSVIVTNKDGSRFQSPQGMLNELLESIAFDPLSFSRMKPKEQFDELRKTIKVDFDFESFTELNKNLYDTRTKLNRVKKQFSAEISAINYPADTPDETLDTGQLLTTLEELESRKSAHDSLINDLNSSKEMISDLEKQLECEKANEKCIIEILEHDRTVDNNQIEEIKNKISLSSKINRHIADKKKQTDLKAKLKEASERSDSCSKSIEENNSLRNDAIKNAVMPVAGLSLGDNEVLFNSLPLEQASDAERLKLSCAIAMAGSPDLKILRIKDGALLDNNNLELLHAMATEKDYQIWVEKVDDSGTLGIIIEDGKIKKPS